MAIRIESVTRELPEHPEFAPNGTTVTLKFKQGDEYEDFEFLYGSKANVILHLNNIHKAKSLQAGVNKYNNSFGSKNPVNTHAAYKALLPELSTASETYVPQLAEGPSVKERAAKFDAAQAELSQIDV